MAKENSSDPALNEYFEAMSFTDDEEKTWRQYTDSVLLSRIESLTDLFRNQLQIPIQIRAFGSSAEKLKFFLPENIGDIDVMVFSTADETKIDESILEYSITDNPIFVRLRGKDHPIFQHCLAENSDYVASTTLKDFHPKVFGDIGGLFHLFPKIFQKIRDISSLKVATMVENSPSPAIQLNFAQDFESLSGQFKQMKGGRNFQFNEENYGFLEWLAISLNPERTFTEEHSAVLGEYLKICEENIQKFSANPNAEDYGKMFRELTSGSRIIKLREKVQELDKKVAEKRTDEDLNSHKADEESVTDKGSVDEPSEIRESSETRAELKDCDSHVDCLKSGLVASSDKNEGATTDSCIVEGAVGSVCQQDPSPVPKETDSAQETSNEPEEEASKMSFPVNDDEISDTTNMTKDTLTKFVIEKILEMDDPSKSYEDYKQEYLQSDTKQKGGLDIVPAFLATGWPSVACTWISRDRLWPNQSVISSILEYGYHIVVKSVDESDRPDLDFRLSFSHAEYALSKELNDIQRECYRCFKFYHLTITQSIKPNIFATYFLKTILLWAVEKTGMEFWNPENRGNCVMMLLEKLLEALETKFLPHYFIPEFNLLKDVVKEFPQEVEFLAREVRKVCENPMSYPNVSSEESYQAKASITKSLSEGISIKGDSAFSSSLMTKQPSCRGQPANLSSQEQVPTKRQYPTLPENSTNYSINTSQHTPPEQGNATEALIPRYKDFQDLYRQVYREMLDLALNDGNIDTEDPTIKSIVNNLREVMSKMEVNPEDEMKRVLEYSIEKVYSNYIFHSGPNARHRMLSLLKGQCEMFAYVARQDDLIATGNEQLIVNRMLNPSNDGNTESFDLDVLYPQGSGLLRHVFQTVENQFNIEKQAGEIEDDIPLD